MAIKNEIQLELEKVIKAKLALNRAILNTILAAGFPESMKGVFQNDLEARSAEIRSLQGSFHFARTRRTERTYKSVIMGCQIG